MRYRAYFENEGKLVRAWHGYISFPVNEEDIFFDYNVIIGRHLNVHYIKEHFDEFIKNNYKLTIMKTRTDGYIGADHPEEMDLVGKFKLRTYQFEDANGNDASCVFLCDSDKEFNKEDISNMITNIMENVDENLYL